MPLGLRCRVVLQVVSPRGSTSRVDSMADPLRSLSPVEVAPAMLGGSPKKPIDKNAIKMREIEKLTRIGPGVVAVRGSSWKDAFIDGTERQRDGSNRGSVRDKSRSHDR